MTWKSFDDEKPEAGKPFLVALLQGDNSFRYCVADKIEIAAEGVTIHYIRAKYFWHEWPTHWAYIED